MNSEKERGHENYIKSENDKRQISRGAEICLYIKVEAVLTVDQVIVVLQRI